MTGPGVRSFADLLVSLTMGVAAVVLLWDMRVDGGAGSAPPSVRTAVEDVLAAGLSAPISNAAAKGSTSADAVIIEFGDFECPFCARYAAETFEQIERNLVSTGKIQYVFRHLPLPGHPLALSAAQVADCAGRQDRFWEMKAYLHAHHNDFVNQIWFSPDSPVGVDPESLENCIKQADRSGIEFDLAEASRLSIRSTPTFLIGKRSADGLVEVVARINGAHPYSVFRDALVRFVGVE
jgi:protein-disulfide isomerase